MGLGLGMGIQMGPDGRFYASMGGQTMSGGHNTYEARDISTIGSGVNINSPRNDIQDNLAIVNNSYPGPANHNHANLRNSSVQKLPSS